jgi:hypothetical protein
MLTAALVLLPASAQAQGTYYIPPTGITPDGYVHYGGFTNGPHMIHGFIHLGNPYVGIPQPGGYLPLGQNNTAGYAVGAGTLYQRGYASPFLSPGTGGYRYTTPTYGAYNYYNGVRAGGYVPGNVWAPH